MDESDYAGVVPSRPPMLANQALRLILVGSIQERKGQIDAVRAVAELTQCGVACNLTFVGDGNEKYIQSLKSLSAELGVAQHIRWAGFSNDPQAQFREADVALMCSRNEPFGMVTVESMSLGLPTVGAKSGGTVEIINDGVTGLLYEVGDHKHLAKQINQLRIDSDLTGRIREAGYHSSYKRFGIKKHAEALTEVYAEAIQSYRSRQSQEAFVR